MPRSGPPRRAPATSAESVRSWTWGFSLSSSRPAGRRIRRAARMGHDTTPTVNEWSAVHRPGAMGSGWVRSTPEVLEVDGLDEVGVEAGLLGAAAVLVLAVAGHGHEHDPSEVLVLRGSGGPPRSRPCRAGRCRAGRRRVDGVGPARGRPGRRRPSRRPGPGPEEDAQARGVAAVVVDDQDAPARELAPGRRRPAARRPGGRPAASRETGRRTVNSLPWPGPSLWAVTRPSCISTSERTRVSPIPRPPRDRDRV